MCHLLTRYQSTIFPNHKSCVRKKGVPNRNSIEEIFQEFDKEILCKILSCLIQGNLSLVKELSLGTKDELVEAVSVMYSDMEKDTRDIYTAVESISNIIAMPK